VDLERSSSGLNGENLLDAMANSATSGSGGGELGFLLDVATNDVGGPGIYFSTRTPLACGGVSSLEISEFLTATVDDRTRKYVAWKRREIEASLPQGHRICARCRVSFKGFDNAWGRAGLCSKACYKAFMKSWAGDA
jgi:hypothetical protein